MSTSSPAPPTAATPGQHQHPQHPHPQQPHNPYQPDSQSPDNNGEYAQPPPPQNVGHYVSATIRPPTQPQQAALTATAVPASNAPTQPAGAPVQQPFVYPQYTINPIPGSQLSTIGFYPPRPNIDSDLAYPNFNIAISHWPFYALPFPFNLETINDINANLGHSGNQQPAVGGGGGAGSGYGATGIGAGFGAGYGAGFGSAGVASGFGTAGASCGCGNANTKPIATNFQGHSSTGHQHGNSAQIGSIPALPAGAAKPTGAVGQTTAQHSAAFGGIIGFIPIVFFPAPAPCQHQQQQQGTGNSGTGSPSAAGNGNVAYPLFPEAFPFASSPCSTCQTPAVAASQDETRQPKSARKAKVL